MPTEIDDTDPAGRWVGPSGGAVTYNSPEMNAAVQGKLIKEALVRIATLYLKIPKDVVTKYLNPQEWKELVECYNQCR